jgi:Ser/Thr protein kinase RdoA (MazF antagonist)
MTTHPYDALTPEVILDAVERFGVRATGAFLALNSYENRVYRVDIEDHPPMVAKFYRPHRWPDAAILEEHAFALELAAHEIPVVAPLNHGEATLHRHQGFRFALFPWRRGRAPELNTADDRRLLGRFLGRLHRASRTAPFRHRPRLNVAEYGEQAVAHVLNSHFVPPELVESLRAVTDLLLARLREALGLPDLDWIRLHGDCHLGNILWDVHGPFFVDLDDCLTAPAVQDLWMLLSGERDEMEGQLQELLEGYTEFMDFNPAELRLVEPLRTLRMLHYNAWLARRWDDPAFPRAFPWFGARRYWEEQILALKQQLAALDEEPLVWRT